jgi:hypothetical protein
MPPRRFLTAALLTALLPLPLSAAPDLAPTLGKRGKLILEEKFNATAVPAGWTRNTGDLDIHQGALRSRERAADQHLAAFRKPVPLQDCLIQVDVKLDGPTTFHLGFDPAPGELKKKGHLFSLILTPEQWSITEHVDKSDPKSKNNVLARAATKFSRGTWFTLALEVRGNDVVARVEGQAPLRATAKDFHVKKPGLVFRVGGKGEHAGSIDNLKIWQLE